MDNLDKLLTFIANFLKKMLENFKAILGFYDNSKAAIDEAVSAMEAAE